MSFNRDDRRGGGGFNRGPQGGRGFGGGRNFGRGRSDRPVEMHKAICSNCGKECEVPFRPTGEKPVFCSDCFREQGGPDRRPDRGPRSFERREDRGPRPPMGPPPPPPMKREIDEINAKLDKIMRMLAPAVSENVVMEEKVVAPKKPRAKKAAPVEETVVYEAPVEEAKEAPEEILVEESSDKTE
ncbi:MAG TPA: CxxC-x17-CxxC domain-containing protein [Patescibacteria group bacterium]|nr:CxxC-x17-CxxC domain-containing protein [Patescibacteria group bacterium]